MDTSFEQKVRERAYEIWVAAGMMDGNATEHWLSAQHSLLCENEGDALPTTIRKAKVTKARGSSTKTVKATRISKPRVRAA